VVSISELYSTGKMFPVCVLEPKNWVLRWVFTSPNKLFKHSLIELCCKREEG
jgi:hypothetical protein